LFFNGPFLSGDQISALAACMFPKSFPAGAVVIREGEEGNELYIIESGSLEVFNETVSGRRMGRGALFGELALLYNCKRTASVRVLSKDELNVNGVNGSEGAHLWVLKRTAFQAVMVEHGLRKRSQVLNFLKTVKLFSDLSEESLSKVVDVSSEREYAAGEYIVREGAKGDTFFVIQDGGLSVLFVVQLTSNPSPLILTDVRVTQKKNGEADEIFLRKLGKGDYFGEKALTTTSSPTHPGSITAAERGAALRTANVIAEPATDGLKGVTCLVIDREAFHQLIKNKVHEFGHTTGESG
jgi:cGMP-dependent protein kinase